MADAVTDVIDGIGAVDAVGVGMPGLVDHAGVLRVGANLPGVRGFAVRDELGARLGVPVVVDNDANCALWAEHEMGAARGTSNAVLVTLGTGIGGGIVADGRLQRGANGFAGEPGHMVVDPDGPLCPCGRRGCWERYASGSGIAALAREAAAAHRAARIVELAGGAAELVRGEHVTRAAAEGDAAAIEVLARFGRWVALGIANLVNILDPEVVVVGGGVVDAGDLMMDPIRAAYTELVLASSQPPEVRIVPAELGSRSGAIGAALLARELPARELPARQPG
jgi:glucokinase